MGQKVHPNGFRLGVIQNWSSLWYAQNKNYADLLHEDLKLRDYVKKRLYHTGVAKIDLERAGRKTKIHIYTARPGLVIGQRGAEVDKLRYELEQPTVWRRSRIPTITIKAGEKLRYINVDKRTSHSVWLKDAGQAESERVFGEGVIDVDTRLPNGEHQVLCGPHWQSDKMIGTIIVEK